MKSGSAESIEKELDALSDQELQAEAKKLKSFSLTNAVFIGFLAGIIFYSIAKSTWGLFTLIPLFFIYKLVNDPKNLRAKILDKVLQERNLK
ncbi:FUSC family protein [Algoriphagus aestuariicola]|uniref:FUSC family protein n=1 Tax=Algoriphagus aestuariicola TaxID=1852016 RepID=A0ABS3BMH1_9BACT|nr:FUSC family protein [Algoriphagus aestuariicola]MBN7800515.1 FUSC family protein [Algoriphagus aestuariicola]